MIALAIAGVVQVDVWRAISSNGDDGEDDDFKIRMEERQLEQLGRTIEEKRVIIGKLKEARLVLLKEREDVKHMHDYTHGDKDQARQSPESDSDRATFENPLQE